jgi:hypothetical protein
VKTVAQTHTHTHTHTIVTIHNRKIIPTTTHTPHIRAHTTHATPHTTHHTPHNYQSADQKYFCTKRNTHKASITHHNRWGGDCWSRGFRSPSVHGLLRTGGGACERDGDARVQCRTLHTLLLLLPHSLLHVTHSFLVRFTVSHPAQHSKHPGRTL